MIVGVKSIQASPSSLGDAIAWLNDKGNV